MAAKAQFATRPQFGSYFAPGTFFHANDARALRQLCGRAAGSCGDRGARSSDRRAGCSESSDISAGLGRQACLAGSFGQPNPTGFIDRDEFREGCEKLRGDARQLDLAIMPVAQQFRGPLAGPRPLEKVLSCSAF